MMQLKGNRLIEYTCRGRMMIFNMCQCSQVSFKYHLCCCLLVVMRTLCLSVANMLQCLEKYCSDPLKYACNIEATLRWEQSLCLTLICFGWRQLHAPRRQNECCHGTLCMATQTAWQLAKVLLWHSCQSTHVGIVLGLSDLLPSKVSNQVHNVRLYL